MRTISFFLGSAAIVVITSCSPVKNIQQTNQRNAETTDTYGKAKLFMAAYQQKAAEYRALCYQAYNSAHWNLAALIKQPAAKPWAIMTDIDETVLDNSPYQVHQSLQDKDFDQQSWYGWTRRADADTVPGALHFFQYAASLDVEIFYVSNRDLSENEATIDNLKKYGFPFADAQHVRLKSTTSSKIPRRDSIAMTHTIIMQVGDNLNDLNGSFEKKSIDQRFKVTDGLSNAFGATLIVLPNPSYGEWENALFQYRHDLAPSQKDSLLKVMLRSY